MVSIGGYSAYVPYYRIERASIAEQHGDYEPAGETAVPAHDENVLTMATKVAKNAVTHAGAAGEVDAIFTATTSDPFDERGIASQVAVALETAEQVRVADFQGSPRAVTNAVLAARDALDAGSAETVLVIATDVLRADSGTSAEQTAGAGAGAVVLSADGEIATLAESEVNTTGFVGRFKPSDESPVEGDARFNRRHGYVETVTELVDRIDLTSDKPVDVVLPAPNGKWPGRALRGVEFEFEHHTTFDDIGYAGAASVLVDLALAFDRMDAGDSLLLVSYGPGGSDALVFEGGAGLDDERERPVESYLESKEFVPYAKHRAYRSWNRS